jgi:organic hydroperoxide reductase OsmC/OhrA
MPDRFTCHLDWSGSAKGPTSTPDFSRDLDVAFDNGTALPMSSAPAYKGDLTRLNPEQLAVAALSACQALTYLYVAARHGVSVVRYVDDAEGRLALVDGRVRISQVTLRPAITVAAGTDEARARDLVETAHEQCFVANSMNARISIEPTIATE